MALYLRSYVDNYRTVYNPIEYVLEEDNATLLAYAGFKYIVGVYDGVTLLGQLKIPLDVNNYGRADVHGICESYLTSNLGTIGLTTGGLTVGGVVLFLLMGPPTCILVCDLCAPSSICLIAFIFCNFFAII